MDLLKLLKSNVTCAQRKRNLSNVYTIYCEDKKLFCKSQGFDKQIENDGEQKKHNLDSYVGSYIYKNITVKDDNCEHSIVHYKYLHA